MASVVGKTEIGLTKKTTDVEGMDENNWSKLMYYINSIATVLRMDDDNDINRLRRYKQFRTLTNQDKDQILIFCTLLAPEILENKCIFQDDSMCHEYLNEFYDLSVASTRLVITADVLIGGSKKAVQKIMCYTKSWLKDNYTDPYNAIISDRRARRAVGSATPRPSANAISHVPNSRAGGGGSRAASASTRPQTNSTTRTPKEDKNCVLS